MIEFYLSSDGKHTVHLSVDSTEELTRLSPVAKIALRRDRCQLRQQAGDVAEGDCRKTRKPTRADASASRSGGRAGGSTSADLSGTRSADALTARSDEGRFGHALPVTSGVSGVGKPKTPLERRLRN